MHKLLHQSWPLDGNLTQHFGGAIPNILEFLWMKTYSMGRTSWEKTNTINISSIVLIRTEYIVQ